MGLTGDLLGAAVSGAQIAASVKGNKKSRQFARQESKKSRDFVERLSNTAHQRQIADLRKAGLNPILSAGGGGASTQSGAALNAPQLDTSQFASSGLSARRLSQELKNMSAGEKLTNQQETLAVEQTGVASAQKVKLAAETAKIKQNQTIDKPKEHLGDVADEVLSKGREAIPQVIINFDRKMRESQRNRADKRRTETQQQRDRRKYKNSGKKRRSN